MISTETALIVFACTFGGALLGMFLGSDIMETRWLVLGGLGRSVPLPFLVVVVFWLTIIFGSFGLLGPRNVTVLVVLFLCSLSDAGAIFLILEMDQPFEGLMKISSAPLR